jgi:hypothetical protein
MRRARHPRRSILVSCRALWISAIAAAVLVTGCDGPSAREYQVTLTEAALIDCDANETPLLNEEEIRMGEELADQVEDSWEKLRFESPPRPQGRTLQVTDREGEMRSWFEEESLTQDFTIAFGPSEVYVGYPDEEIIDGTFDALRNVTREDGDETVLVCVNLVDVRAALTATLVDGMIDGRVRRTERFYYGSIDNDDYCELRFECVRDVAVTGVERD